MSPTELHDLAAKIHELGNALAAHASNPHAAAAPTAGALPAWLPIVQQVLAIVVQVLSGLNPPAPAK